MFETIACSKHVMAIKARLFYKSKGGRAKSLLMKKTPGYVPKINNFVRVPLATSRKPVRFAPKTGCRHAMFLPR